MYNLYQVAFIVIRVVQIVSMHVSSLNIENLFLVNISMIILIYKDSIKAASHIMPIWIFQENYFVYCTYYTQNIRILTTAYTFH